VTTAAQWWEGARPRTLPLASRSDQRVGQWVGAVGHGLGGVWAFTTGMVSNLYEAKHGAAIVQTQIPLNPGNSGGPIFDRTGRVVAVVSKGATNASSLNVGVHVADAFMVFDQLLPRCDCLAIDVAVGTPVFVDDELAGKGYRALGVARSEDDGNNWSLLGILPMFDPPRDDSKQTIDLANAKGVRVTLSGGTGDDAKHYQERDVKRALAAVQE